MALNFENKLKKDFEDLKNILLDRYPKSLNDEDIVILLKRTHKSLWALQICNSKYTEDITSALVSSIAVFETILIKNPDLIVFLTRSIIEKLIFILSKDNSKISQNSYPREIFDYLLEKHKNTTIHSHISTLKDKHSKHSMIIHNKTIKEDTIGAVNGINEYWKFYCITELESAVEEYIKVMQEFITIVYLSNVESFYKLSENDQGIIINFLTKKQIKEIKNIIE